jgi:diacylglycerol kinase family enzyme
MAESNSVLLLHNPRSGARHAKEVIDAHVEKIQQAGFEVISHDSLDAFENHAKQLFDESKLRAVVAAGGDGTASAVASRVHSTVPIWLCPLGTENLLARYLQMRAEPSLAAASICDLRTRQLDAGLANNRLFLIMASVGFDADVVRRVHTNRRGHIRKWHYWLPILQSIFTYRFPRLQLRTFSPETTSPDSCEAAWCFVMNVPRYADGLSIAPMAIDADGKLDACTFKQGGFWNGLRYLRNVRRGTHLRLADFEHTRITCVQIDPPTDATVSIAYQLDGDFGGYLPLEIKALPKRLTMIEPFQLHPPLAALDTPAWWSCS